MRSRWAWLLAVALVGSVLAGCVGSTDETETDPSGAEALPTGTPTDEELAARGLDQAPQLREGEWFEVEVTNQLDDGATYEERLVVLDERNGSYVVGTPTDGSPAPLLILHLPGLGLVDRSTFGYEAHDVLFEPVQFPLEKGRTWETEWYTGAMDAEVVETDGSTAEIELVGENTRINVTYDARLGLPAKVEIPGYGSYEVTDHGFEHAGAVEAPVGRDLVILNGRIGPALDPSLQPGPPVESVDVEEGYDRMTLALVLGNLVVEDTTGVYRASATAPDGTTYEATFTPTPDDQVQISPHVHEDPAGTWDLEYEAGGPGVAVVEAVAYDVVGKDL